METELISNINRKEEKTEVEHVALKYFYTLSIISEILVQESKNHLISEEAITKIRNAMSNNL